MTLAVVVTSLMLGLAGCSGSPQSQGPGTTSGGAALRPCILSAKAFGAVVGIEGIKSSEDPDYKPGRETHCFYESEDDYWYVYVFPEDGELGDGKARRHAVEVRNPDKIPIALDAATHAFVFNQGRDAIFTMDGNVVQVQVAAPGTRRYGEELARALAAEIAAR